ncbi:MAG: leucyl aminopeptidase family protein [Candidatus Limnocylindrus sp.]
MRFSVSASGFQGATGRGGVLAIPLAAEKSQSAYITEVDRRSGGQLTALRAVGEASAKRFHFSSSPAGGLPAEQILFAGLGGAESLDRQALVRWAAAVTRKLAGRNIRRLVIDAAPIVAALKGASPALRANGGASFGEGISESSTLKLDAAVLAVELIVRGVSEGSFHEGLDGKSRVEAFPAPLESVEILLPSGSDLTAAKAAVRRSEIIADGTVRTKRWSNRPANEMPPLGIAEEARDRARAVGLRARIIGARELERMGAGMLMAVGRGSENPPCMVVLSGGTPRAKDPLGRRLAMVGKGVCFDTGGISIKPADGMEEMKMDKNGAIAVLEAAATVAQLDPGRVIHAVAACVENMPSGHATRPGDVVTALNGKRVEITNTDAEGRLILGDALHFAERELGATHLVDVATLTGIVYSAFGGEVAGSCGSDPAFLDEVHLAARRAGEVLWPYPLADAYVKNMDTWSADMQNSGTREASLVRSGLFLREFTSVPWVHLDIAGTAYRRSAAPWAGRGSTGSAHPTLVELAMGGGVRR